MELFRHARRDLGICLTMNQKDWNLNRPIRVDGIELVSSEVGRACPKSGEFLHGMYWFFSV